MKAEQPKKQEIPEPRPLKLKPRNYQPSKAELEEEIDMPGMTEDELREAFMRPFEITEEA